MQTKAQRAEATERVVKELVGHRAYQHGFKFPEDDHTNGEMLSAAMSYINVAKQQVNARDESKVVEYGKRTKRILVGPGGTDLGYPHPSLWKDKPSTWPFDKNWAPDYPRYNLIRAATLIVAELERLERRDKKLLGKEEKKKTAKELAKEAAENAYTIDVGAMASAMAPSQPVGNPSPYYTTQSNLVLSPTHGSNPPYASIP